MDSPVIFGLLIWLFSIIGGIAVGVQRGQETSGVIWPFLFGPLGFIVVLCLPNLKKREQEAAQYQLQVQQIELQRQQLEEIRSLRQQPEPEPDHEPIAKPEKIKLAKNGKEWGDFSLEMVREMLDSGELTLDDYFFSPEQEDWITLDQLPD